RPAVQREQLDLLVFAPPVERRAGRLRAHRDLLEGLGVHEHDLVVGRIQVRHGLRLRVDAVELLARTEGLVEDRSGGDVTDPGAHAGAAFARFDVLKLDDGEVLTVDRDRHTFVELTGGHYFGHEALFSSGRDMRSGRLN